MGASTTKTEIVSSETEALILVNERDEPVGHLDKSACHNGAGVLHRAFSLFIFNAKGELLLQQRAANKRLWPNFWSNSCCSHPRQGESMELAVERRQQQELGLNAELTYLYKFQYQAAFQDIGSENELCSVYLGRSDREPTINTTEISAWRWISPAELDEMFVKEPASLTPWFKMEWQTLRQNHHQELVAFSPDA